MLDVFKVPTTPESMDAIGPGAFGEIFMTIGSLFSGIGGLELGLEWAGLGPTIWQVEKDEKCRNCLATHWPEAKRFEDVCTVGRNELEAVDLICGGFPCQDVSSAGKRVGLSGARSGLWVEFLRIARELRPSWIVVENVASGAPKWVDTIRFDLARIGYGSLPVPLSAADCGAWHIRERIFIVAYFSCERERESTNEENSIRNGRHAREKLIGGSSDFTYVDSDKLREQSGRGSGQIGLYSPQLEQHSGWETEPNMARVVHGLPGRVDRERSLGNSVVPQCAEVIGEVIKLLAAP